MAEAGTYYYETAIEWKGEKSASVTGPGLPALLAGAPPEFNGREGQWAPEHLLVASLNACYMLTLLAIAENSKINLVSYSCSAKGKLEKVGANYQITEIVVCPRVLLASVKDLPRMPRVLEKAKENCFISNSIKASIKIEPEVSHQQMQTSPCPLG